MGMTVHYTAPAGVAGTAATTTGAVSQGALAAAMFSLGIALIVLTALFASVAVAGLLPRRESK
jgi:hypothetical protein